MASEAQSLSAEEIAKLDREYDADPEGFRMQVHSARALLAMASRLVELESALGFFAERGWWSAVSRTPDQIVAKAHELGWPGPTSQAKGG